MDTPIINDVPTSPTQEPKLQAAQMKEIRALGKDLVNAIHDFAINKQGDLSYLVVVGACDYVIKLHRARVAALGAKYTESYIKMEMVAETEKLAVEEPYMDESKPSKIESILTK